MMNSFQPNNSGRRRLIGVTILVIFLFCADVLSGGKIRTATRIGGTALWQVGSSAMNAIGAGELFATRSTLQADNGALRQQVEQLQERATQADVLVVENKQLRALANLAQASPGISAPIISATESTPYGTFIIGAGSAEGIALSALVLTPGGFAVGTVSDVGVHSSVVVEVLAPGATVEALLNGATISASGSGGGNAHVSAPRGLLVHVGDPIFSALLGQRPIGVVGSVASSSAGAAQDVYIRLPINLSSQQYVYVVSTN